MTKRKVNEKLPKHVVRMGHTKQALKHNLWFHEQVAIAKGVDLLTVQRMAGHSDPRTTSGYDLRPEEDMRTAATMLHLPYQSIMNSKN